jgi:hypothetical protein
MEEDNNTDRRSLKIESREYKIFKEEELIKTLPVTLYEKACNFSVKLISIDPGEKEKKKLQKAIDFSHLKVTPEGVSSLTILSTLSIVLLLTILTALNFYGLPGLEVGQTFIVLLIFIPFLLYLHNYPYHVKKIYEIEAGSEIVNMILYMVIYMRNNPNLEGAIKYSAQNLTGRLVYELRKLLWDVEIGNYVSMQEGLLAYSTKWVDNKEFIESVDLIIGSLSQTEERRLGMLDQAVEIILAGNRENAKHFTQDLNTPVMFVHAIGVILPLLGFVMFPLLSVFLNIGSLALFTMYDIILPIILFFVIKSLLEKRPATFSKIDISESPEIPKPGHFFSGEKQVPALPVAIGVFALLAGIGLYMYSIEGSRSVIAGLLATGSVAMATATYYYLTTSQALKIRENTRQIEQEFSDTLFRMGNSLSSGIPVERSLEQSVRTTKNLKVRGLFLRALDNITRLGMTFRQAFFDEKYGAVNFYPSKLIKSVMTTVVESSAKGSKSASTAMLSVARYLKDLHATQEDIRAQMNDTISSMKFQAFFMSPLIAGIVVTLTLMILQILGSLASQAQGLPFIPFLSSFYDTPVIITEFILVVGVYLFQTCVILSIFINGIENGQDREGFRQYLSNSLFVGFIVFWIVIAITVMIFMPLIQYAF